MKSKSIFLAVLFFAAGVFVFSILAYAHEESALPAVKDIAIKGETHHIEVKPESLEGYRIPYMVATVTIIDDASGKEKIVTLHPMFGGNFHYGANVTLEPKKYLLRFHLDPPTLMRGHSRENQWLSPVESEFSFDAGTKFEKNVKIGSKEMPDMKISFEVEYAEEMFVLTGTEDKAMAHEMLAAKEEPEGLSHQFQELLPFEHLSEGHWLAVILSFFLWTSLIYTIIYSIKRFRQGRSL